MGYSVSSHSDEELIGVYQRNIDIVYRLCYLYLKNPSDADDAVQSVFLKWIESKKEEVFNGDEATIFVDITISVSYTHLDLKTYVSEEKRKQMANNAQNGIPNNGGFNPFMPSSNPFMGGGFGGMTPNPFMNNSNATFPSSSQKPISSLTNDEIDKMIADIDKKLKELDEEESREKEKMTKQNNMELPKLETQKPIEQSMDCLLYTSFPRRKQLSIISKFSSSFRILRSILP